MSKPAVQLSAVLLIDDNEDDNYLHTRQLLRAGIVRSRDDVLVMTNGEEALAFFADYEARKRELGDRFPPPLVLLDINMPRMNGFEFLAAYEQLEPQEHYTSAVFLMLTTSDHPRDRERAARFSWISGFLSKPLTRDAVINMIAPRFIEEAD